MITACEDIRTQQKAWAKQRGVALGEQRQGYVLQPENNLFVPLSNATQDEFRNGKGGETGSAGDKPRPMQALLSSSALVCNVFEFWRKRSLQPFASACGAPVGVSKLEFEKTYPTGLGGTPPHLDVVLIGNDTKPFTIEAKYTEPYCYHSKSQPFAPSYFARPELWTHKGLTSCYSLAKEISEKQVTFQHLWAPQLLKHILGLANKHSKDFTLLYLWYDWPSPEATAHREEVARFASHVSGEVDFHSMTYNELFKRLQSAGGVSDEYLAYLGDRYFSA